MTVEVQTDIDAMSPEDLQKQMAKDADAKRALREKTIAQSDLDALRSIKDKEISAERKLRGQLESRLTELESRLGVEVDRRQHAETVASESQAEVNLRIFARQLAQSKFGGWGPDIQKAAEEKLLAAENRQHLMSLEHEFVSADLPRLLIEKDKEGEREERKQRTLEATVGIVGAQIPTSPTPPSSEGLDKVDGFLDKARTSLTWKNSSEGQAALREAKQIVGKFGYPINQIRSWAQVANAIDSIRRYGKIGTGVKRTTQV